MARTFSLDSNCMIAAVCEWHEHHAAASKAIEGRFKRGQKLIAAGHAITEAYAVLTRLPAPHRLSASDAWHLVKTNFVDQASIATLAGGQLVVMIDRIATAGIAGGRTYDALIAATVASASVDELLTLNPRHFDGLSDQTRVVAV